MITFIFEAKIMSSILLVIITISPFIFFLHVEGQLRLAGAGEGEGALGSWTIWIIYFIDLLLTLKKGNKSSIIRGGGQID